MPSLYSRYKYNVRRFLIRRHQVNIFKLGDWMSKNDRYLRDQFKLKTPASQLAKIIAGEHF